MEEEEKALDSGQAVQGPQQKEPANTLPLPRSLVKALEQLPTNLQEFFYSLPAKEQKNYAVYTSPNSLTGALQGRQKYGDIGKDAKEIADQIAERIAPGGKLPAEQLSLNICLYPTDLCRVSPFFPLSKQDMAKREYIEDLIIASSSWGTVKYKGSKLSTSEEDLLMAILAAINAKRRVTEVKDKEGEAEISRQTYTYKGPFAPIMRLKGLKGKIGKTNYQQALKSLDYMLTGLVKVTVSKNDTRGKRKHKTILASNMISSYFWDEKTEQISITVNPYFYEAIFGRHVTPIDVATRAQLRSPIAKQIYNFSKSHSSSNWEGHFMVLAAAINLDVNDSRFRIREALKRGMSELIKKNILDKKSGLVRDRVSLIRTEKPKKSLK